MSIINLCLSMLAAINLNNKTFFKADKIQHKMLKRMLSSKFCTKLLAAQTLP